MCKDIKQILGRWRDRSFVARINQKDNGFCDGKKILCLSIEGYYSSSDTSRARTNEDAGVLESRRSILQSIHRTRAQKYRIFLSWTLQWSSKYLVSTKNDHATCRYIQTRLTRWYKVVLPALLIPASIVTLDDDATERLLSTTRQ